MKRRGLHSKTGQNLEFSMLPLDVSVTAVLQLVTVGPGLLYLNVLKHPHVSSFIHLNKLNTLVLEVQN